MKIEDLVAAAPPPDPLPIPHYDQFFTDQERQAMQQDLLLDLADEIILVRSHLQHLFQATQKNPSPARLVRILDLVLLVLSSLSFQKEKLAVDSFVDSFPGLDLSNIPLDDMSEEH
jgi:hypothetical protein